MRIYDLTGTLEAGMWDYGEPFTPFSIKRISSMEEDGYVASQVSLTTHTGTHIDCARHFGEEKTPIDKLDVSTFLGGARLLDVSEKCRPGKGIGEQDLIEAGGEELYQGQICVLKTGWETMWDQGGYTENYPYLTVEGAEFLATKKIKLFAADIPIVGNPHDTDTDMVFCAKGIPSVYGLVNLGQLPETFTFAAFPLKLAEADGSPVRAVAWEEGTER